MCITCKLSQQTLNGKPQKNLMSPISKLPLELIFDILEYLDPVESTCFGLTNKLHYNSNRSLNPDPVDLGEIGKASVGVHFEGLVEEWEARTLYEAIGPWMKSGGRVYSYRRCLFVKMGEFNKSQKCTALLNHDALQSGKISCPQPNPV
jgi:hypothetical protein